MLYSKARQEDALNGNAVWQLCLRSKIGRSIGIYQQIPWANTGYLICWTAGRIPAVKFWLCNKYAFWWKYCVGHFRQWNIKTFGRGGKKGGNPPPSLKYPLRILVIILNKESHMFETRSPTLWRKTTKKGFNNRWRLRRVLLLYQCVG